MHSEEKQPIDNEFKDNELKNVEQLIQKMSLKQPEPVLERRLGIGDSVDRTIWLRECVIALACLLFGILIGRMLPVEDSNGTKVVSRSKTETTSKNDLLDTGKEAANNNKIQSEIKLIDEGLFLINGEIPVRKYTSIKNENVTVVDPDSGRQMQVTIPLSRTVVTASDGI